MRIAVLGAGALGLTVAMRLARRGAQVTVIEREPELGGLAAGFKPDPDGDVYLEKFYHHLFRSDTDIQELIDDLGLKDRLQWLRPITATLYHSKAYQLDSPVALLKFSPLSFPTRIRMGAALAYLKAEKNYKRLAGQTAAEWIQRWMGKEAYDVVWKPQLQSKFGEFYPNIAAPWFWARVHCRSTELGYVKGGFQNVYIRLGEEIQKAGGEIRLRTAVTRIAPTADKKVQVATAAGVETYDKVVSTLPTKLFLRLTEGLTEEYRRKYDWGDALGAMCAILALDKQLFVEPPVYWLSVTDPGYPFLAAVEHTNMMPASDYGGQHLLYLGNYLPVNHRYFTQPDEMTIAEFLPHLKKLNPQFEESWVKRWWLFKAPFAQPVVTREYAEHIPPLDTPIPNLYMANMFQVYPQDRGQNYSIRLANRLANLIRWQESPAGSREEAVAR